MTTNEMTWTKFRKPIAGVDQNVHRFLSPFSRPDQETEGWTVYKWNSKWCIDGPSTWFRISEVFDTLRDAKEHVEQLHQREVSDQAAKTRALAAIDAADVAEKALETTSAAIVAQESATDAAAPADPYWNRDTRLQALERRMETIRQMQESIPRMVHHARAAGASWADIGGVLGVSLQAAHKRYASHPAAPSAMREAIKGEPLWDDEPTA